MEAERPRIHYVLTKTEVHEKMLKEIQQISEVFSLSKSDATVILLRVRWNSFHASDRLSENKEKFMAELGLVQAFDVDRNESFSCFPDHKMTRFGGGGRDDLISTPFCSHKFCTTCWRDYFNEFLEKKKKKSDNNEEEELVVLLCPNPVCIASVGPDTIGKFAETVKKMYESYVLESFMVSNKESIKWCPAPGCEYAIERHEDHQEDEDDVSSDFGVVCLCGHTFCWSCKLESHRPVTCENASRWLDRLHGVATSLAWIEKNTKPCPHCKRNVEKNGDPDLRLITCICGHSFCWLCFRSEEEHNRKWNCKQVTVPSNVCALTSHLSLWEATDETLVKAKSDLKTMEENIIPKLTGDCGLGEQDMRALSEAAMLVVQCSQFLKWNSLFGYFMTEDQTPKKPYLDHLQGEANTVLLKHKETLHSLINGAISAGDIICFKHKVETSTNSTGNYFHYFLKSLEDGLPEVEVNVDEDASSRFCDRCTFQNSWGDKECKVCFIPFDCGPPPPPSPSPVHFGNNNT